MAFIHTESPSKGFDLVPETLVCNAGKEEYKHQQQTIGNIKIKDMEKDRGSIGKKIQGWGKMLIPSLKDTNTISTPKLKPIHATFDNKVT